MNAFDKLVKNFTEAASKLKVALSTEKIDLETQYTLEDGRIISCPNDQITEGEVIQVQDSAGNWAALVDGDYVTVDGLKFSIAAGVVSAIDASGYVQEKKEEVKVEEKKEEVKVEEKKEDPKLDLAAEIAKALAPLGEKLETIDNAIKESNAKAKVSETVLSAMAEVVTELSKQPSGKQIEKEINPFRTVPTDIKESRAYKIMNAGK